MEFSHRQTVFADYFQFILMDATSDDDFSSIWTADGLERMVAVCNSTVSFGALRNVNVQVEVHVQPELPRVPLEEVDHAVEGSIEVPTGILALLGCTDSLEDAYTITVPPGSYRFLYLVTGVDTIVDEWSPASDLYTVYLAPGSAREPALLKHWREARQEPPV